MAVKPGQDRIRHPGNGSGARVPDGVAEEIDEEGEDQGSKDIPDGNIEKLFRAPDDRLEEVQENQRQDDEDQDVDRPYPFGVFPALGESQGEGDRTGHHREVPHPRRNFADPFTEEGRPQQSRDQVMSGSEQSRADETENDNVGMHRPKAAEDDPGNVPQKIGGHHMRGVNQSRRGPDDEPEGRAQKEELDGEICFFFRFLQNDDLFQFLSMTRQPTIQLGVHLAVTADTKPHFEIYGTQAIHVFHFSMALRAVQTGPFDVGKVIEINEIWHPENPDPGHRLFLPVMLLFLENLGM